MLNTFYAILPISAIEDPESAYRSPYIELFTDKIAAFEFLEYAERNGALYGALYGELCIVPLPVNGYYTSVPNPKDSTQESQA